ncbi:helix-turn-helix domain-containing protein [Humidesulfovibrio sp.]|jgi:excisionase family DNA binding protein
MIDIDVPAPDGGGNLPRLLTIQEVADILRIHARTAYRLVKDGSLSAIRVGTQWRVTEDALHEYVARGWRHWKPEPARNRPKQCKLPL